MPLQLGCRLVALVGDPQQLPPTVSPFPPCGSSLLMHFLTRELPGAFEVRRVSPARAVAFRKTAAVWLPDADVDLAVSNASGDPGVSKQIFLPVASARCQESAAETCADVCAEDDSSPRGWRGQGRQQSVARQVRHTQLPPRGLMEGWL